MLSDEFIIKQTPTTPPQPFKVEVPPTREAEAEEFPQISAKVAAAEAVKRARIGWVTAIMGIGGTAISVIFYQVHIWAAAAYAAIVCCGLAYVGGKQLQDWNVLTKRYGLKRK